jgi:hypothetical protein
MYQKDYILRMVEMIGDLIAAFLGLLKKGDLHQAEKLIERGYVELLSKDASFFLLIPNEKLTDQLIGEHHYEHYHLEILAELFYAEAKLAESQSKPEHCLACCEKSQILTEFLEQQDKTWSATREERKHFLQEKITMLRLSNA